MKKRILLLILFTSFISHAQNNTVASGTTATGSTGSATYSIGQIVYQTNNGSSGTISQGMQQAFEIVTLSTNDVPQIQLVAIVYPNPTTSTLTVCNDQVDHMNLVDLVGKKVMVNKIVTGGKCLLDLSQLSNGIYILNVAGFEPLKVIKY